MKSLFIKFLFGSFILFSSIAFAQTQNENYTVQGKCGMCKTRIETAAKDAGATSANWDEGTKILKVAFDAHTTSKDKILKRIAEVGHDNEMYKADDKVYENLPDCCHYDRTIENTASTSPTKKSFFVHGKCSMCKARIETAAKDAGALSALWNVDTQKVELDFDPTKTSAEIILKKIAEVGHDNEMYKAEDKVYENLPSCCHYDRTAPFEKNDATSLPMETPMDNHQEMNHSMNTSQQENDTSHQSHNKTTNIQEVKVTKAKDATSLNKKEAGLVFNIDSKELLKAACCNLSESFETNATVDVSYSNAVTGTKQLKMLGLDQKYTALTKELLPEIRGIASAYGLNFIPGRWIGGIQLTKGGSTVTNGYESITGQINTELLKYQGKNETNLNLFLDNNTRTELNLTQVSAIGEHWNQSILLHANGTFAKKDYNHDGFLDQPTGNQINVGYLINYNDLDHSGWASHFGINLLKDERHAGQMDFNINTPQASQSAYGVGINTARAQIWNKTGFVFAGKPYRSLGWMNQFTFHQQDSFYGLRNYDGKQATYYSNLIYEDILGNTNNKYKVGASFLYDHFNEDYLTNNYQRTETVPGVFAEYTLTGLKYTLVAGARVDFHNLAGTQFTPRLNFKYDITPKTILRLSAGRGFRTANIFAENQQYFASNRKIVIIPDGGNIYGLKPEIAWNYGASMQQELRIFGRKSTIVADFFRTDFQNQVVTDLDHSTHQLLFYNLSGKSFANSFQTQWDFTPIKNLDFRIAYKFYNVETDYLDGRKEVPFMPKHRGFVNASYATTKTDNGGFWSFDTTLNVVGKQRIPSTTGNPVAFQMPATSKAYATLNAQIAKNFNEKIRVYLGADNITGTEQKNPILDAQNPFGNYFDASMIYAPIMPGSFYLGLDVKF